ncbi:GNAT family N-acetyltransferase [Roseicella aerolata]|uniref:GNAT family N-acetyltransferase n=1 Tax=Roseicella aerolata TaxID=2883479 RepID=A0A9X1IGC0_9PROT|nr:GNAT family N-acetyltransferase [Roseicella aerolata]MCB4824149.1 GNAT family N-acetyltransferase [Roseicella aerolata]
MRPDPAALAIEEVTSTAALEGLRPDWEALWNAMPGATPFQSPAWLIPWWRHVGEGALFTLALRAGGALVGLFPLYRYGQPEGGERVLFPLGIATTDYLDALVRPGWEAAVPDAASRHLALRAGCDAWEWPQLRPGSPLLALPAPPGWAEEVVPADPCPGLDLPDRVEDLAGRVSGKTLRDLRTVRRRAAEAGALRWETEAEGIEEPFEALLRLHGARWATRGEAGVLASPGVQAAHREALPALHRAGLLRFHVLRLDGAVVAVLYALADPPGRGPRRLYFYLSGFDPALERLSPGMLLVGRAVEAAIAEGFAVADFLRGRERYKYFWGAADQPTFRRRLIPPREAPPCAAC